MTRPTDEARRLFGLVEVDWGECGPTHQAALDAELDRLDMSLASAIGPSDTITVHKGVACGPSNLPTDELHQLLREGNDASTRVAVAREFDRLDGLVASQGVIQDDAGRTILTVTQATPGGPVALDFYPTDDRPAWGVMLTPEQLAELLFAKLEQSAAAGEMRSALLGLVDAVDYAVREDPSLLDARGYEIDPTLRQARAVLSRRS